MCKCGLTLQQSSAVRYWAAVRAGKTSLNICSYYLSLSTSQAAVPGGRNTNSTPAQSAIVVRHQSDTLQKINFFIFIMKQKKKSILESIFRAPFGLVMILLWVVLCAIVLCFKVYNEIRYHLSEHIFDGLFILGIILFGVTVSIISYFINKRKEKNTF